MRVRVIVGVRVTLLSSCPCASSGVCIASGCGGIGPELWVEMALFLVPLICTGDASTSVLVPC